MGQWSQKIAGECFFMEYISQNHSFQTHCFGNLLSQSYAPRSQIIQIPQAIAENVL